MARAPRPKRATRQPSEERPAPQVEAGTPATPMEAGVQAASAAARGENSPQEGFLKAAVRSTAVSAVRTASGHVVSQAGGASIAQQATKQPLKGHESSSAAQYRRAREGLDQKLRAKGLDDQSLAAARELARTESLYDRGQ